MIASRNTISSTAIAVPLAALVAAMFLLLQVGHINGSDGHSMYAVTRSLIEHGQLSVDPADGVRGVGGAYYSKYTIGLSLLAIVPFVVMSPLAHLFGHGDVVHQAGVATLMPLVGALMVAWLYVLARRLGASTPSSLLVAVGGVVGSFVLIYVTKEFFGEPVVALCIVITAERLLARHPMQAGAALAFGVLVRPQTLAVIPILLVVAYMQGGSRWLLRAAVPLTFAVAVTAGYNAFRFGSVTSFGYSPRNRFVLRLPPPSQFDHHRGPRVTHSFGRGVLGLLAYPTKSFLLFVPAVILVPPALIALWRRHREIVIFLSASAIATFVVVAAWAGWAGGWCWGPRLLIPALIPLLAALAPWIDGIKWRARAFICLSAAGFLVSASALVVATRAQTLDPRRPPRVGPVVARGPAVTRQYALIPATVSYTYERPFEGAGADHRRYVALWQVNVVRQLGRPGLALAGVLTALLLAAAWKSLALLRRRLATASDSPLAGDGEEAVGRGPPPARAGARL
jgi:hypothetical protein